MDESPKSHGERIIREHEIASAAMPKDPSARAGKRSTTAHKADTFVHITDGRRHFVTWSCRVRGPSGLVGP
jgi:HD superfamily phosphodiesterase